MYTEKELFYEELRKIQEFSVGVMLSKQDLYTDIEEMLDDVTFDVIYKICEMIDGCKNELIKYTIVNEKNENIVNENFMLHDWCESYLKCTDK